MTRSSNFAILVLDKLCFHIHRLQITHVLQWTGWLKNRIETQFQLRSPLCQDNKLNFRKQTRCKHWCQHWGIHSSNWCCQMDSQTCWHFCTHCFATWLSLHLFWLKCNCPFGSSSSLKGEKVDHQKKCRDQEVGDYVLFHTRLFGDSLNDNLTALTLEL